ncbi:polysaccharide deacetylase family protein [Faecalibacterium langellae]|uniref:Xylanase/chitin deacetylase n=1 Tax=Faecalibacterium langellae TaxID=3435293 RepID=A0ACC9CY07_9FIRM|nr:polysaccharide deacetylase family protein [Faecalibacterium prausnitzii]PDX60741.1 xylanase/chitin deacetylase [Faecalibacterium prausnitzii]
MKLSAHRFRRNRTLLLSALLLALIAGFTAGAQPEFVGCSTQDLTPVPDTAAFSPAATAFAEAGSGSATEEPLPEKWVCLTFDDGPSKTTPDVLAALNTAGVHGTFFVVATDYNEKYLPLLTEAAAAGHQIALHSASHEYSDIYQSSDAYWEDIALLKERIAPYVDVESIRYLRFPGGSTNTVSRRYGGKGLMKQLKAEVEQKGLQWVDWNVCAEDAVGGHPSADTIYRNVVRETGQQTNCIVLMHDSASTRTTAEALPDIIQWYTDNGYTFLTVAEALPLS